MAAFNVLAKKSERVVAFYNQRGTVDQEGKGSDPGNIG